MDGQMDGWTDGWIITAGRMCGTKSLVSSTDSHIFWGTSCIYMDEFIGVYLVTLLCPVSDGWMDRWMDGLMDGSSRLDECVVQNLWFHQQKVISFGVLHVYIWMNL